MSEAEENLLDAMLHDAACELDDVLKAIVAYDVRQLSEEALPTLELAEIGNDPAGAYFTKECISEVYGMIGDLPGHFLVSYYPRQEGMDQLEESDYLVNRYLDLLVHALWDGKWAPENIYWQLVVERREYKREIHAGIMEGLRQVAENESKGQQEGK